MNASVRHWQYCRALAAVLLALASGCVAPLSTGVVSGSRTLESPSDQPVASAGDDAPANAPAKRSGELTAAALLKATSQRTESPEEALGGVLDELQEIRAIDPAAEEQLMADLREAKPEHYPMIVQTFRTALAYRKQLAEREAARGRDGPLDAKDPYYAAKLASHEAAAERREQRRRQDRRAAAIASDDADSADEAASAASTSAARHDIAVEPASIYEQAAAAKAEQSPTSAEATARVVAPADAPRRQPLLAAAVASDDAGVGRGVEVQPSSPSVGRAHWQQELEVAIADLQQSVNPQPSSVHDLHDHMRLRTLELLAGREEDAYRPIPGASPEQQDYWSKQLFAMAAYLDGATKLDDKQRAAAALTPLDEARAKLSELATLQVCNLAFAKSVDGFGAYQPLGEAVFQPGQEVTVYAEVENFRSTSTKEGYETSLGTSYQVLDKNGHRVAGSQFPDVADVCRNRRQDFHLQYGIVLPTRIYPGEYRLELTITDHRSGKIGQSSIPFEIAGER